MTMWKSLRGQERKAEGRWRKSGHVTSLLEKLHWLPIKDCIVLKILLLTCKALKNKGPIHLKSIVFTRPAITQSSLCNGPTHAQHPNNKTENFWWQSLPCGCSLGMEQLPSQYRIIKLNHPFQVIIKNSTLWKKCGERHLSQKRLRIFYMEKALYQMDYYYYYY